MNPKTENATVVADAHVHLYPVFNISLAILNLMRNLRQLSGASPSQHWFLGFLTEGQSINFFNRLRNGDLQKMHNGIEISPGAEAETLTIHADETGNVKLVAGRQIVSHERLEILALAMRAEIPDGLPADDIIKNIRDSGGIPVLAWAPGKWFFERGRLARALFRRWGPKLLIGDTSLRPRCWPEPRLMRYAREQGAIILPGSDPLPFAGEEQRLGGCGFIYQGAFDPAYPAASIRKALNEFPSAITPAGTRCGAWRVARRLIKLRSAKKAALIA